MYLLEVKGVMKFFGGISALNSVDFQIDRGEIVGLIGPNGAGKTTLFNVISGVHRPEKGEIRFNGENITGMKPHIIAAKGIARTFQITQSFGMMSVFENILTGAVFGNEKRASLKDASKEVERVLKMTQLEEKALVKAESLTAPEARKLEFARAIAARPDLILLDEVMAGLRPAEIEESIKLVMKVRDELGITIFMVEHIMKTIMKISDRIVVLEYGRQIAKGTPKEVSEDADVIKAYLGEDRTGDEYRAKG